MERYDRHIKPPSARPMIARLIKPLYLPALFATMGVGMIIPVLPLYLREAGFSYTLVTTVIAAWGVGSLIGQIPLGALIARIGERVVMVGALLVMALAIGLLGVFAVTIAMIGLRMAAGIGSAGWLLSRHSFMTTTIPEDVRGRASSFFGGVNRVGMLIGPVIGGLVASRWGFETAFALTGVVTALGILPLFWADQAIGDRPEPSDVGQLRTVIKERWRALASAGTVQMGVVTVRAGREAIVPLLGVSLGLEISEVGLLVAAGSASDLALFPVAGMLMDRFGRLAALVPSMSLFGVGLLLAGWADTAFMLVVAGLVMGLGNGLGAGTMMTIGSDLAPEHEPSRFLSVLGSTRDLGRIIGPLLVGWFADSLGLSTSAVVLAVVAFATSVFTARVLGDTRTG